MQKQCIARNAANSHAESDHVRNAFRHRDLRKNNATFADHEANEEAGANQSRSARGENQERRRNLDEKHEQQRQLVQQRRRVMNQPA